MIFCFFKQKTAYEMRISDWSSDVCSSDLKDEDDDGIEDANEGSAVVRSLGEAPAMRIGAADRDVTIGAVAGTGTDFGLIIDGTVVGSGVYAGKDATGLQIGGLGGAVDISGGARDRKSTRLNSSH